jgi:hypothetical protein
VNPFVCLGITLFCTNRFCFLQNVFAWSDWVRQVQCLSCPTVLRAVSDSVLSSKTHDLAICAVPSVRLRLRFRPFSQPHSVVER